MRILYLTDTRAIGGAERNLADLAGGALAAGHEVLLAAPQHDLLEWLSRETPGAAVKRGLSDAYHDTGSPAARAGALLAMAARMVPWLRRIAPDVVHVNNGGFPGSDLCRIATFAARAARVPCRVMTVHSNPWPRARLADERVQALADRLVWSSVDTVISPSDAVAEGLRARRGMPARLGRTIYYGVRRVDADPAAVARIRRRLAPAGELLVGMVSARPVPEKGYDVFLDALRAAPANVRGVLVGRAPEDLAANMLDAGLAVEGPRRDVGDYYAALDVLVVPSTAEECMPLVILEAAGAGTPAFGSRLSGIPEAIADGLSGRLFEPGDARGLARLIAGAARDRDGLAAMGRSAHARWRERFGLDAMVRATLALYDTVAPAARRRLAR